MTTAVLAPIVRRAEAVESRLDKLDAQRAPATTARVTGDWRTWLLRFFAPYVTAAFAQRHISLWEWFEALAPGVKPRSRVEVWPRGGGKSSSAELGVTRVGSKLTRRFVLYISGVQHQADEHVQTIGTMFERLGVTRAVNDYGQSKGWRHSELHTADGFNIVALGLDVAVRGVKIDEFRPDLIILDDIDSDSDSPATRRKKVKTITKSIIPTGSSDCAVLVIQNMIDEESIVATLVNGTADFLHDREIATVEPAVVDLTVEHRKTGDEARYFVTGGTPTWAGQDLQVVEAQINDWGYSAFLEEAQHEVSKRSGGLWVRERDIDPWRVTAHPELVRICVAVDPNAGEGGDAAGIIVAGGDANRHGYVLEDCTVDGGPEAWALAAVAAFNKWHADVLVAESNNGGDMVKITIGTVKNAPAVKLVTASRGKLTRAEPIAALSTEGRWHMVGRYPALEKELCTWAPGKPSPNRMDAMVWAATELLLPNKYSGWAEHMRRERTSREGAPA